MNAMEAASISSYRTRGAHNVLLMEEAAAVAAVEADQGLLVQ